MRSRFTALLLAALPFAASAADTGTWMAKAQAGQDLYATLHTSAGDVTVKLLSKDAPKTVSNFVGLAAGEKEFTDPNTHQQVKRPFFDGTIFHRVIAGFMIQGGDPLGTGMGNPGYTFEDENQNGSVKFDHPGVMAMANAGHNTNGSQFFITVAPTAHLNGGYSVFGEVVKGYDVVEKISKRPDQPHSDRPVEPVVVKKVDISDKPPKGATKK